MSIQSDPKRVKKALPKILKTLKPEHRVQIIGVSSAPFGEGNSPSPYSFLT